MVDRIGGRATASGDQITTWIKGNHKIAWWLLNLSFGGLTAVVLISVAIGVDWMATGIDLAVRIASILTLGFTSLAWIVRKSTFNPTVNGDTTDDGATATPYTRLWRQGAAWSVAWLICALIELVGTYWAAARAAADMHGLLAYATDSWAGRLLGIQFLLVAIVAATISMNSPGTFRGSLIILAAGGAIAVSSMVPGELYGPPGNWQQIGHQLPTAFWVGGLGALVVYARATPNTGHLLTIARAYSELVLAAALMVAFSGLGLGLGWLQGRPWSTFVELPEGRLILLKLVLFLALGGLGGLQRTLSINKWLADADSPNPRILIFLALVELVFMGAAIGVGVGLTHLGAE